MGLHTLSLMCATHPKVLADEAPCVGTTLRNTRCSVTVTHPTSLCISKDNVELLTEVLGIALYKSSRIQAPRQTVRSALHRHIQTAAQKKPRASAVPLVKTKQTWPMTAITRPP